MVSSPAETSFLNRRTQGFALLIMEKQNHEDLLRGRVSIIDHEYPSITLFLLGGLLSLLCRGLLRRHGFFTPFHPPWIDL
jgi:hypothetical protein